MEELLNGATQTTSSVKYNYPLTSFPADDGKFKLFCIDQGIGKVQLSDEPVNRDEDYEPTQKVTITMDSIEPEVDSKIKKDLRSIYNTIMEGCEIYYPKKKINITLVMDVTENGLVLLDESSAEITDRKFASMKTQKSVTITDYISQCIEEKLEPGKCCSGKPDCDVPSYVVPHYVVVLARVMKKFPEESPASLKHLVKVSMEDADAPCYCCVACNSDYIGVEEVAKCAKIIAEPKLGLPPREFQPLSDEELHNKRKYPVGIGKGMNKPYSFSLNLQNSPYKSVLQPKKPAEKPFLRARSSYSPKVPEWAERLSSRGGPDHQQTTSRPMSSLQKPEIPVFPTYKVGVPQSQILARKIYGVPHVNPKYLERPVKKTKPKKKNPEEY
ncbi:hypothetical protein TVAG_152360 [Trichomonas vaginalis G3]|uniref:Uncharacterized protein n=1 Tax=Trichomonas vaginalis (strain ATCC PRA-98 / G3) TaxID=412133 RepID=A2F712_TRIV3|nr:hypothetical protein TVAG_152360 [Trichomonas vaginalis G3]|eukprot:XP_001312247.1 hypothetical protein [Trichomonas vaginalis G3]